ncbi:hypothetical protein COY07_04035 [Candidatus Peregrinibacteria bacterium CG_4_10_14_0_2_um_filter_43_11]|nr:MAG: hypothetical protein COY07_04035 [Candidatus Peregrinibacteria bacterium CG_4_10_14_0_2_um_filter_43_11]
MYVPPKINAILMFPTGDQNRHIKLPKPEDVRIGDILVAKYNSSRWVRWLPWENWHHAALVVKTNPLTIIEAAGENSEGQLAGPTEVEFGKSVGFGKAKGIKEVRWLRPIFPNPLREVDSWLVQRSKRKIIAESEARKRVAEYAKKQVGESYAPASTKWNENSWYCSLLVYKSYSRTVTGMYLETYDDVRAGFLVTPEDLLNSKRTKVYFSWKYENNQIEA